MGGASDACPKRSRRDLWYGPVHRALVQSALVGNSGLLSFLDVEAMSFLVVSALFCYEFDFESMNSVHLFLSESRTIVWRYIVYQKSFLENLLFVFLAIVFCFSERKLPL